MDSGISKNLENAASVKGEATQEKKRKLDPTSSGECPSAINGNVEHASEDLVHERIKGNGQQASFKRGIKSEAPNAERQGSKFQKRKCSLSLTSSKRGEHDEVHSPRLQTLIAA